MKIRAGLLILVALSAFGCERIQTAIGRYYSEPARAEPPEDIAVERDIVIAQTADGPLALDLYTPKDRPEAALPVVIWIYGGGWAMGNRNQIRLLEGYDLTRRGYAVASIEYRLSAVAQWPAQIHDVKAAVRWLRANADRLGLDPDRFGAWGASAGGHLAALVGVSNDRPELEGDVGGEALRGVSSRVQAVVNYFGPSDFLTFHTDLDLEAPPAMITAFLGGSIAEARENYVAASPVSWVSADAPPMWHVHGSEDPIVSVRQAERLHEALVGAGADSTLRIIEGVGHGGSAAWAINEDVADFFDRHLRVN